MSAGDGSAGGGQAAGGALVARGLTVICGRDPDRLRSLADLVETFGARHEITGDPASTLARVARLAASGTPATVMIIDTTRMTDGDPALYDRIASLFGTPRIATVLIGGPASGLVHSTALSSTPTTSDLALALSLAPGDSTPPPSPSGDANPQTDPAPPPTATKKPMRILLAEDNEVNQMVAVGMLNSLGHEVDVVVNGAEAVKALENADYDAILMDVRMPVMDGLEATRAIRALAERGGTIPIIAVTANAMRGDQEACIDAGMNDYLAKPIRLVTLEAALKRWLPTDN